MRVGIFGRKVGMTQIFDANGSAVPVTVIDTTGCSVTQVKSKDKEKYCALQVAVGERKPQNLKKPMVGHLKKAGVPAKFRLKEIRLDAAADMTPFKAGQALSVAMFSKGDRVDVAGVTKGTGFTGVMKRFGFHGKHATHGTSKYFRHGGSNGSNTFPGRVLKNKGMPGQDGSLNVTIPNIEVIEVLPEESLILLRGAVPGHKGGYVMLRSTKRAPAPAGRVMAQ